MAVCAASMPPHQTGDLRGVLLQRRDCLWVGRGLDDDDALLGHLIGALDLVLVAEDRVQRGSLDRQSRVASFDALAHVGHMLLDDFHDLERLPWRVLGAIFIATAALVLVLDQIKLPITSLFKVR